MDNVGLLAAMMFFGFMATEGAVEYIFSTLFDRFAPDARWALKYISLAVGVGLAFHYGLDAPHMILGVQASPVGIVATGVILGRGANFVSDVWQRYFSS